MGRKILYSIMVEGGWGVLTIWTLWGSMPDSNCASWNSLCPKYHLRTQLQVDFEDEEECKSSSDEILADEYPATADQGAFQLGFGSSIPRQKDKAKNLVITIIDRSGIHENHLHFRC